VVFKAICPMTKEVEGFSSSSSSSALADTVTFSAGDRHLDDLLEGRSGHGPHIDDLVRFNDGWGRSRCAARRRFDGRDSRRLDVLYRLLVLNLKTLVIDQEDFSAAGAFHLGRGPLRDGLSRGRLTAAMWAGDSHHRRTSTNANAQGAIARGRIANLRIARVDYGDHRSSAILGIEGLSSLYPFTGGPSGGRGG
jgi:hypothetical protein